MGKYRVLGDFMNIFFRRDLNANFDDVDADIKLQKARIDTLFQETPQADEALDIRVRSDGTVASTAGNRVRELDEQLAKKATKEEVANALDGSPKGTYATLADLQTAFPTGTTGVYIVQAGGHIYSWDGSAWVDRGQYQSEGIADKSVDTTKIDDYLYKNIIQAEKFFGSNNVNVTIDSKDLNAIASNGARTNTTRIIDTPATETGLVTLHARFIGAGTMSVLILEKGTGTQFRTIKKQTFNIVAGAAVIETDLVIKAGQYIGIYEDTQLYYKSTTGKQTYSYTGEIGSSFVTTTGATTFDFSYYYQIGGRSNVLGQIEIDTSNAKDELLLYNNQITIDQSDLSTFPSTTGDGSSGTFRINNNPASATGTVKLHVNLSTASSIEVFVLERQVGTNSFKKVNSEVLVAASGINAILTDLIIYEGQYVGVLSKNNVKYLSTSGVESYNLAFVDITNYTAFSKSTTLKYGYYYEITPTTPVLETIKNDINDINAAIKVKNYKTINTIYVEKFIGTVLPTPPFGSWLINGVGTISDGVMLTPAADWTAYLQLTQRTHFDSDGVKWRVKLNDITSKVRIERRTAASLLGFSSTAELDNGTLRIYQSEMTASGNPTTVLASKTVGFTLIAGREYTLTLELFGEILTFTVTDTVTGQKDSLTYTSTGQGTNNAGRSWDYPRFYFASGDVKILQFDYFSRLPKSPKTVITGDSILEGDTIRNLTGGGYANRWAGLLYKALQGDVVIMGSAGETSSGIIQKLPVINKAFKEPEYALLAHMVNDSDFTTWKNNTEQLIQAFVDKGTIPVICMMPMRSGREPFYDAVLDYVVKSPYKVIWFNRALTVNGDGKTVDTQYYTADNLHPNVAGHKRMFDQVKADLEEIFPLSY